MLAIIVSSFSMIMANQHQPPPCNVTQGSIRSRRATSYPPRPPYRSTTAITWRMVRQGTLGRSLHNHDERTAGNVQRQAVLPPAHSSLEDTYTQSTRRVCCHQLGVRRAALQRPRHADFGVEELLSKMPICIRPSRRSRRATCITCPLRGRATIATTRHQH